MKYLLAILCFLCSTLCFAEPQLEAINFNIAQGNNITVYATSSTNATMSFAFWIGYTGNPSVKDIFTLKVRPVIVDPNNPSVTTPLGEFFEYNSQDYFDRIEASIGLTIPTGQGGKKIGLEYTWQRPSSSLNGPFTDGTIFNIIEISLQYPTITTASFANINKTDASQTANIFALGNQGNVLGYWSGLAVPTNPSHWQDVGGTNFVSPAVGISKDAFGIDLFAIKSDNQLYTNWWSASTQLWSGWSSLGGNFAPQPVGVVSRNNGTTMDVVAVGVDQKLYHKWWSGSTQQ